MSENVYVLLEGEDCEGARPVSVHTTLEGAMSAVDADLTEGAWYVDWPTSHIQDTWRIDHTNGGSYWEIRDFEIEEAEDVG